MPRLLFLHGFLQNGKLFSEKSSGIRKLLKKSEIECDYIDGPIELEASDLPFQIDPERWRQIIEVHANRAWFYHNDVSAELDLTKTLSYISDYIRKNGPYDGIVGFSQGAAVATILTNKMTEIFPDQLEFKVSVLISGYSFTEPNSKGDGLRITPKFQDLFKPNKDLNTHIIFIYGTNDTAVPAVRAKWLANLYKESLDNSDVVSEYEHSGGHMVPNKKDFIRPIVAKIENALARAP